MSPRASALPPTERRVSIVRSAIDLIHELGTVPSTRDIAEASGVAEGTVFRAFETKDKLLDAVVAQAFCPAPVVGQMARVDAQLPLRERLVAFVTVLQSRFTEIFGVMRALGLSAPPAGVEHHRGCTPVTGHIPIEEQDPHATTEWGRARDRLEALVQADADALTCSPADLLTYLRLLTFSGSHAEISEGVMLGPEAIVDVVLYGVLKRSDLHTRSKDTRSKDTCSKDTCSKKAI